MYADRITEAMRFAIEETERRRERQKQYNDAHGITPQTVKKAVLEMDRSTGAGDYVVIPVLKKSEAASELADIPSRIEELRSEMLLAAEQLDFEKAAQLRDTLHRLNSAKSRQTPGKDRNDSSGHAAWRRGRSRRKPQ